MKRKKQHTLRRHLIAGTAMLLVCCILFLSVGYSAYNADLDTNMTLSSIQANDPYFVVVGSGANCHAADIGNYVARDYVSPDAEKKSTWSNNDANWRWGIGTVVGLNPTLGVWTPHEIPKYDPGNNKDHGTWSDNNQVDDTAKKNVRAVAKNYHAQTGGDSGFDYAQLKKWTIVVQLHNPRKETMYLTNIQYLSDGVASSNVLLNTSLPSAVTGSGISQSDLNSWVSETGQISISPGGTITLYMTVKRAWNTKNKFDLQNKITFSMTNKNSTTTSLFDEYLVTGYAIRLQISNNSDNHNSDSVWRYWT